MRYLFSLTPFNPKRADSVGGGGRMHYTSLYKGEKTNKTSVSYVELLQASRIYLEKVKSVLLGKSWGKRE